MGWSSLPNCQKLSIKVKAEQVDKFSLLIRVALFSQSAIDKDLDVNLE